MCFNAKTSLFTFLTGIISSILLIYYGNKKYKTENTVFGLFFIFISFMQFFDLMFWTDLKNKKNINKIATSIAPLFNLGQPLFLYFLKILFYKHDYYSNTNIGFSLINIIYFGYIIFNYSKFISENNLITCLDKSHLKWEWLKYFNPFLYLILLLLNFFYLSNFKYSLMSFIISAISLILSYKYFNYHIGEIWCFFGVFIPIFILLCSYLI